ncbi:MAG: GTP-binding protein [Bacteroidetes bacterium]|nr:MAG: GTP-binding protein [Bacteroidota bacterium]
MFTNLTEALDHNRKTKEPYLDLGRLGLRGNEPALDQLKNFTWLEVLSFSYYWYELDKEVNEIEKRRSNNEGEQNQLTCLPALPSRLEQLFCKHNKLIDITPLQGLSALINLDLGNNHITDITPLKELSTLDYLFLHNNQIIDIAPLKELNALNTLDISNNQIIDIAPLKYLNALTDLFIYNNPFWEKIPQEIQRKDSLKILRYWFDSRQAKPLREAKVVFVGEGNAGKTSLMHALLYGRQEQTTRTEKIEIHTNDTLFTYGKKKEKLKLRFWDFGGQDIMHATHKFFMSSRTLYVLVIDGRKEETEVLQNWVEMLKSSIEDSPVLLVVNKLDEPKDTHRLGDLGLKAQFPNLVLPVIETSWQTGRGLDTLKEAIQNELQKMPHFQQDFSAIYQSIKAQLETIQEPYIDYRKYENLCTDIAKQEGESSFEQASQSLLADILNDLGVMLNFRKKSDKLEDLLIFKPAWIVDGVYQIINAQETQAQKGKIHEDTITTLLKGVGKKKDYQTAQERSFILEMMKHFKLAYQQQENVGKHCYLIPSLFDKNPPADFSVWQASSPLRVRFQYEIWRNDYISYFLVTQHTHTIVVTHWANGAILRYGEQQARMEAVRHQKHIDIQVVGTQDKRYALWRIREALAQVHAMFDEAKLGISMWVIHEEGGKEDEFEYDYLKVALEEGETQIFSKVFRKKLSILALLEGVSLNKTETKETLQKALAYLEKANLTGYFAEMDKVEKDFQQNITYSQLKKDFVDGEKSSYFAERLGTFAKLFV